MKRATLTTQMALKGGSIGPEPHKVLSKERITLLSLVGVAFVLAFEVVKAIHHSIFIAPMHEIDYWATAFWGLDSVVAAIVTFVMIKVAFSFDRLEGVLEEEGSRARNLSDQFSETQQNIEELSAELSRIQIQMQSELVKTQGQIQNVAHAIESKGDMLRIFSADRVRNVLDRNSYLYEDLFGGLNSITRAWAGLIQDEADNSYAFVNGENLGLRCWSTAIETYLQEEALDIGARTVATNLALYIKLIDAVVGTFLECAERWDLKVELFASTNLLPREYYNWREYTDQSADDLINGVRMEFMDDYRDRIKHWLKTKSRLSLKRVVLVQNLQIPNREVADEIGSRLSELSVRPYQELSMQGRCRVLWDNTKAEIKRCEVKDMIPYADVNNLLIELHKNEETYAIAPQVQEVSVSSPGRGPLRTVPSRCIYI